MKSHQTLSRMCVCAVFAAILCICCPIAIPIGPIPITLSVFAVMLCGVILNWRYAVGAILVYLVLGLFLPVFSGGKTGIAALPGPTGGYIWSYLLMIPVIRGFISIPSKHRAVQYLLAFCGCAASLIVCYACGTVQFSLIAGRSFLESLSVCVTPFIGVDLLKAAAAAAIGVPIRGLLQKARLI